MLARFTGRRRPLNHLTYAAQTQDLRGVPQLLRNPDGAIRCVACSLCAGACPAQCIVVEAGALQPQQDLQERGRQPLRFDLDLGKCLFCGLCEAACPEAAISLSAPTSLKIGLMTGAAPGELQLQLVDTAA
jgi:NADH-quinone oxidoreductase subunit I